MNFKRALYVVCILASFSANFGCTSKSVLFLGSGSKNAIATASSRFIASSVSQARVADRNYVASVFQQVYGFNSTDIFTMMQYGVSTNGTGNIVANSIYFDIGDFGGPCDVYSNSDACQAYHSGAVNGYMQLGLPATQAPVISSMTSAREGAVTRVCELINSIDANVTQAVQNLDTGEYVATQLPTQDGIMAVYDAFYPGKVPSSDVLTQLKSVIQISQSGGTVLDSWRFLFLTVCLAPDWQVP